MRKAAYAKFDEFFGRRFLQEYTCTCKDNDLLKWISKKYLAGEKVNLAVEDMVFPCFVTDFRVRLSKTACGVTLRLIGGASKDCEADLRLIPNEDGSLLVPITEGE